MPKVLMLNFVPVKLSQNSFSGSVIPYEGPEKLRELCEQYRDTHVFHRDGNQVYCVPLGSDVLFIGDPTVFEVQRNTSLVRRLVHEALIRFFLSRDQKLIRAKPIRLCQQKREPCRKMRD